MKLSFGYHPLSVGFYVSELVRRADPLHRGVSQFFSEEIASPLDLDIFIGIPRDSNVETRIARLQQLPYTHHDNQSVQARVMTRSMNSESHTRKAFGAIDSFSSFKFRKLEVGSAVGFATARDLAYLYSLLATSSSSLPSSSDDDDDDGVHKLISLGTLNESITTICSGTDLVLGVDRIITKAGFSKHPNHPSSFFHSGHGGSIGYGDASSSYKIGFAYTPNGLEEGDHLRSEALLTALYTCLTTQSRL